VRVAEALVMSGCCYFKQVAEIGAVEEVGVGAVWCQLRQWLRLW